MTSRLSLLSFAVLLFACSGGATPNVPEQDAASTVPPPTPTTTAPPSRDPPVLDAGADAAPEAGTPPTYCEYRTKQCKRSMASCVEELKCMSSMRPGAGASIQSCVIASKSCNQGDDCLEAEAKKYANETGAKVFRDTCLAKLTSCGATLGLSDDHCANFVVFPNPLLAVLDECLAKACADAKVCVQMELAKAGCDS